MQQLFQLQLLVVIKVLRYQVAALVAASIIGGGPWTFNADAATFTVVIRYHAGKRAFGQGLHLREKAFCRTRQQALLLLLVGHPTHPQSCCRWHIGGGRAMRRAL